MGYLEPPVLAGSAGLSQCWLPRAVTQCCPLGCASSPLPTEPGNNLITEVFSVGISWLEGTGNVRLLSVIMCVLVEVGRSLSFYMRYQASVEAPGSSEARSFFPLYLIARSYGFISLWDVWGFKFYFNLFNV